MPPVKKPAVAVAVSATDTRWPILYSRTKEDGLQQWRVWVEGDTVYAEHGKVGGKLQRTPGKKMAPVNVGKKNEMTGVQRAQATAESMHKHKLDRKYALTTGDADLAKADKPMLAQRYDQRPKYIKFPCDGQPKMDGNRAAARWIGDSVRLVSRSGTDEYEIPHLLNELSVLLPKDCELDGELYVHGVHPQTINSWVMKSHPETVQIEYWVYDMPIVDGRDDLPWCERSIALADLVTRDTPADSKIKLVTTSQIDSADQVMPLHDAFIEQGFEGLMLRNLHGRYEWGARSNDLQKVKVFEDAEFKITGCRSGQGKMAGCAVWVMQNPKEHGGGTFEAVMKTTMEERRKQFENFEKYVGQMMTVNFFGRFKSGLPRFPRAIKFRSPKDR